MSGWGKMANRTIFIVLLLIIRLSASAQSDSGRRSDWRNHRSTEGSGMDVPIDTVTPLPQLINKLTTDWKFVMTGKAYWIGYTDDMFSIANHGNEAIPLLTGFIDTIHSVKAKEGAIYTLHLIGINSTIVERFFEEFKNRDARNALLKYIGDTELTTTVAYLLNRNPWQTDIPKLMAYLEVPGRDYSKVLSALRMYEVNNSPLHQTISGTIFQRRVRIKTTDYNGIKQVYALAKFQKKFKKNFIVDKEITSSREWTNSFKELSAGKIVRKSASVIACLKTDYLSSYCGYSEQYDYSFDGNTVTVYGPSKARGIWLDWWKNISQKEKEQTFYK